MIDGDGVVDVSEYASALRRWWPYVVVAAVIGLVLGSIAVGLQQVQYESQARVEVRPLVSSSDDANLDVDKVVNTTTEQAIAGSQRVAERALVLIDVAEDIGTNDLDAPEVEAAVEVVLADGVSQATSDSANDLLEQVEVSFTDGSQIIEITAMYGSPERAQQVAQAMAHAYLDFRRDEGLANTELSRQQLVDREAVLLSELDGIPADDSFQGIAKREELAGIGARLANISSISIKPGEVLDDAALPESASGLPFLAGPLSGLLLGALAGLGIAFMLDRGDDRFRAASLELSDMQLRPMGAVPVGRGFFRIGGDLAIADQNSEAGESYRRVQGSLLFSLDEADKTLILVTGTNNPQSTTTVAANLAAAAARSGRRTLLVGADLRRPSMHERFGLENNQGLSDVLGGAVDLETALQQSPDLPSLRILSAGTSVQQPARLLQSVALGRFLSHVKNDFDLVLVEAPPVLAVADAVELGRLCEGVVMVVEPGRASRSDVADSVEQLRRVGVDVVGTIVAESSQT